MFSSDSLWSDCTNRYTYTGHICVGDKIYCVKDAKAIKKGTQ